jgi:hypothetical protein
VPTPQGGWQAYRIERVRVPRQPFQLGVSSLDDPHWGLAADDGTLLSPRALPVPIPDGHRTVELACRDCRHRVVKVRLFRLADHAAVAGKTEVHI